MVCGLVEVWSALSTTSVFSIGLLPASKCQTVGNVASMMLEMLMSLPSISLMLKFGG